MQMPQLHQTKGYRCKAESNRRPRDLQSLALPLSYYMLVCYVCVYPALPLTYNMLFCCSIDNSWQNWVWFHFQFWTLGENRRNRHCKLSLCIGRLVVWRRLHACAIWRMRNVFQLAFWFNFGIWESKSGRWSVLRSRSLVLTSLPSMSRDCIFDK